MKRFLVALFVGAFLVCCVGAVGTATQMAQTGLGATPPPSTLGTAFRAASVMLAIVSWPMARRAVEHITVVTFIHRVGP